ncbi:DUF2203 domain-containing protein [Rugosimonospora acidiphila]|uniref:DUF2203 domain-containing protein n=1 Tax=Rugosimonospora acidiphila TaxID=556531 RepID=A0ABP9RRY9_9ACTN
MYGLDDARATLAALRPRLNDLIVVRADLAELRADLARAGTSRLGGLAEVKGLEARLYADLELLAEQGAQIKGYAPLLLDFPGELDDEPVLWCWLEGDPEITWYHRLDCGFAGRRPVPVG